MTRERRAASSAAYRAANKEKIAASSAAYRAANKESIAAKKAAHYAANKESLSGAQVAYRAANKERIVEARAAYYAANKESVAATSAAWYAANKERKAVTSAAWCAANKEKIAASDRAYHAANYVPTGGLGGFRTDQPGYLYLMGREGVRKVGITNRDPQLRAKRLGMVVLDVWAFDDGQACYDTERALLQQIRGTLDMTVANRGDGAGDGMTEAWLSSDLAPENLEDLVDFLL